MPYIVVRLHREKAMPAWEDVILGEVAETGFSRKWNNKGPASTLTRWYHTIPEKVLAQTDIPGLTSKLKAFNDKYSSLRQQKRSELYRTWYIDKQNGGKRRIDEPLPDLMNALYELRKIFEKDFGALYHTNAYAYAKHRSVTDAVAKHQKNESVWFCKTDFHDFFGSTNLDTLAGKISNIFPFSEVMSTADGMTEMLKAFELCTLNGGLPQGTPISPMLTNLVMIPFDVTMTRLARKHSFVYTRYADDIIMSSRTNCKDIMLSAVKEASEGYPYNLNDKKTKYLSHAGRNWLLGVMLNKNNNMTIGHINKKYLKAKLFNLFKDYSVSYAKLRQDWNLDKFNTLIGELSWYRSIEPEETERIINKEKIKVRYNWRWTESKYLFNWIKTCLT